MDRLFVQRSIRITLGVCLISILSEAKYIEKADVFTKTIRMPNVQPEKVIENLIFTIKEKTLFGDRSLFSLVIMFSLQTDLIIFASFKITEDRV